MRRAKKAVVTTLLALAMLFGTAGAIGSVAVASPTAHAAAATTTCMETYWAETQEQQASAQNYQVFVYVHLYERLDAWTNAYCGQFKTLSCAWAAYMLDPSHTYRLNSETYLNSHYLSGPAYNYGGYTVAWVPPGVGQETTKCAYPTTPNWVDQFSASRGSVVGVQPTVVAVSGIRYIHPYFQFVLG